MVESSTHDRGREDSDLDREMAAHEGLVSWVVRQQWRGDLAFDEALHAGRIGLWHALRGYDPSRGTRFSTYAVPAITRAVWAAVATQARDRGDREKVRPVVGSTGVDVPDRLDRAQRAGVVREMVGDLPGRLRQVIVAHYGLDASAPRSFARIGQVLGVSRQRVQQLHVMALLWLAHPDRSRPVRRLLDHQQRRDYQDALAHQREYARAQRAPRRSRR